MTPSFPPLRSSDRVLSSVEGPEIDKLVSGNPYYRKATIPGGMYTGTDKDITTFGVGAILASSAKVPAEVVYQAVKSIFDNFEDFKQLHPALGRDRQSTRLNSSH